MVGVWKWTWTPHPGHLASESGRRWGARPPATPLLASVPPGTSARYVVLPNLPWGPCSQQTHGPSKSGSFTGWPQVHSGLLFSLYTLIAFFSFNQLPWVTASFAHCSVHISIPVLLLSSRHSQPTRQQPPFPGCFPPPPYMAKAEFLPSRLWLHTKYNHELLPYTEPPTNLMV